MFTTFVFMTLQVPSYAQAKAVYWSPALVVLFVAFGVGVDTVRQRSVIAGRFVCAALLVWATISFSVFWIDADAPETLRSRGEWALAAGRPAEAMLHFERAAGASASSPPLQAGLPVWPRVGSCRVHMMLGQLDEAGRSCADALDDEPDDPDALFHSARIARRMGDWTRALELLERLRSVAPLDERAPPVIAALARRLERPELARDAARQWLRFDPGNPAAIAMLESPKSSPPD
jgi:hypothetical protein